MSEEVKKYAVKGYIEAVMWDGDPLSLTDFSDLPSCIIDREGVLTLLDTDESRATALPEQHYIVRGITGLFWCVPERDFWGQYSVVDEG